MGKIVNASLFLHQAVHRHWSNEAEKHTHAQTTIMSRFERIIAKGASTVTVQGDALVARVKYVFTNGLSIEWSEDQLKIFYTVLFSILPFLYGNTWPDNKARVLAEWHKDKENPFTVVSMARRNGKTFSTAGIVCALYLCVPEIKIAIFSTCRRTSAMMMEAATDMLEKAFVYDKVVHRHDYTQVSANSEARVIMGPDRSKRTLMCLPGSVRVSVVEMCVCVCVQTNR